MTAKMGMWREHLTGTVSDTTLTLTSDAVPDGERRYLSSVCVETDTTSNVDVKSYLQSHGQKVLFYRLHYIGTEYWLAFGPGFWLTEGEYLQFELSGVVNGEVCEVGIIGHIQYRERK